MSRDSIFLSTGLPGLDRVFLGLRPGDNVVFQVDVIEDYATFVRPFVESALATGRRLIYFHFGRHDPIVESRPGVDMHPLRPERGFESFITEVHDVLERSGRYASIVFDALSELSLEHYSDRMLGNFYMLTCPYLFSLHSLAYYALLKNYHSFYASTPIHETTQIFVDVYRHRDRTYVHPRKVLRRYSPTMHMLHVWEGETFRPVTDSSTITEVLTSASWSGLTFSPDRPGSWTRLFLQAEDTLNAFRRGVVGKDKVDEAFHLTVKSAVTREERAQVLVEKYLTLADVLDTQKRMVSSGYIGGKAVGMLLARAILRQASPRWSELLESHDSFFIGSEVFYSYLVENNCWHLRQRQKNPRSFLDGAEEARQRLLTGNFSDRMKERFANMLDYFGQAPVIVRSSSLLEDSFGNAFAGKYESVFCANQGPRHIRLDDFMFAVRRIYASCMSEEALTYRAERGLLGQDEQMALLVQRVSGIRYGSLYFPQAAGVALSYNPYVWSKDIDPAAGMLRLVFGLGTRAVDRADDDYTRVVALNAPMRHPVAGSEDVRRYAQRKVDVLDLEMNLLMSYDFPDVARRCVGLPIEIFATSDEEARRLAEERGMKDVFPWVLTFDGLLSETPFASDMREMLAILQDAYGCPVDVEFTVNFLEGGRYKINLLQCRPLQIRGVGFGEKPPEEDAPPSARLIEGRGAVIGPGRVGRIERFVYVPAAAYARLSTQDRYEVANVVGAACHLEDGGRRKRLMLIGPGRWGTGTPALGVPVTFRQIRPASVLCEVVAMSADLVPDVSLGTHFFSDLIETDTLYVALFPGREGNALDRTFFDAAPNRLPSLLPGAAQWAEVVRILDAPPPGARLHADPMEQRFCCCREA